MTILIIVFAVLVILVGAVIIINPESVFGLFGNHIDQATTHILAVATRLALGVLLIAQSGISKFPLMIEILGWISIVAAIILAAIGRDRFRRLMTWALSLAKPYGRVAGLIASCFGAFLMYAFIKF